ncbi:uncharacterized protein DS421_16g568230 [Arachis hypogaea]|nr:uncharacterized protein DS421_16g568230 [Arachis hypogaea]
MPVIRDVLAFPEELVSNPSEVARFTIVGLIGPSAEEHREPNGGEGWRVGYVRRICEVDSKERVLGFVEPVATERVEVVNGSYYYYYYYYKKKFDLMLQLQRQK